MYLDDNHRKIIHEFLEFLNNKSDRFILKGGTALMMCYGLTRFSEGIDLDSDKDHAFFEYVRQFCSKSKYEYREAKNTDFTKRVMINYTNRDDSTIKPLNVELSMRNPNLFNENQYVLINNILVYNIDYLCLSKSNAFASRDKLRDLFDLVFIYKAYKDKLKEHTLLQLKNVFEYKDIEHVDYLINTNTDNLINTDKLASDYLSICADMHIAVPERNMSNSH